MQTEDNTPTSGIPEDLDLFSAEFYGTGKPEVDSEEKDEGAQEDTPATEDEPTENPAEDTEDSDDEEVGEEDSKFHTKRKLTARERIEQLNAKFREAEREKEELAARLAALEAAKTEKTEEVKTEEARGPSPDDKLEDGTEKYPLGEYDPDYIRDLHRHEAEAAKREIAEALRKEQETLKQQQMIQQATTEWNSRVTEAQERLPDLPQKVADLEAGLSEADADIVESLAFTIMSLENGPDVLYYLGQNVDEAREIAKGGPQALIRLGKIDALVKPTVREAKKVTEAPTPPPARSRGVAGKFAPSPDTDNLEDFEKLFFR